MRSIVYSSIATDPPDDAELTALLALSRANNERDGLTGVLLYRDGRYLQVLEGEDAVVDRRMSVISADARHERVTVLLSRGIEERAFPEWTMGFERLTDTAAGAAEPGYRDSFDDLESAPTGESLLDDAFTDAEDVGSDEAAILPVLDRLTLWYRGRTGTA